MYHFRLMLCLLPGCRATVRLVTDSLQRLSVRLKGSIGAPPGPRRGEEEERRRRRGGEENIFHSQGLSTLKDGLAQSFARTHDTNTEHDFPVSSLNLRCCRGCPCILSKSARRRRTPPRTSYGERASEPRLKPHQPKPPPSIVLVRIRSGLA